MQNIVTIPYMYRDLSNYNSVSEWYIDAEDYTLDEVKEILSELSNGKVVPIIYGLPTISPCETPNQSIDVHHPFVEVSDSSDWEMQTNYLKSSLSDNKVSQIAAVLDNKEAAEIEIMADEIEDLLHKAAKVTVSLLSKKHSNIDGDESLDDIKGSIFSRENNFIHHLSECFHTLNDLLK
jgi:hypothetical protein